MDCMFYLLAARGEEHAEPATEAVIQGGAIASESFE
jgi:hypothetical protein